MLRDTPGLVRRRKNPPANETELQKIMHEDGPIAQPIFRNVFTFYDKSVQGVKMHPSNYFFGNRFALAKA